MEIKLNGLDKALAALNPKAYEKAVARTVTETGRTVMKELSKSIREEYAIKAKDIKRHASVRKRDRFTAVITISGGPLSLKRFTPRMTRKGVTVKIKKKEKRKLIRGAFIVQRLGGHVFRRKYPYDKDAPRERKQIQRTKIEKLLTLSVPQMAREERVRKAMNAGISKFNERLERNLEYYLSRKK